MLPAHELLQCHWVLLDVPGAEIKASQLCQRYRHLLLDLAQLLPHSKKDAKLDTKSDRGVLNEVADMKARTHAASPSAPCCVSASAAACGFVAKQAGVSYVFLGGGPPPRPPPRHT